MIGEEEEDKRHFGVVTRLRRVCNAYTYVCVCIDLVIRRFRGWERDRREWSVVAIWYERARADVAVLGCQLQRGHADGKAGKTVGYSRMPFDE